MFCDTGWEHELTYQHIDEVVARLGVKLITLRSKKYNGLVDLARQKKRFPSSQARFCTEKLKVEPMIDFLLDEVSDHCLILQGIRHDESDARAKMNPECRFFRFYFEPFKLNKKGRPVFHTYRKAEVIDWTKQYSDDILRPVITWNGPTTMQYILDAGLSPNPLYFHDMARVGCFPCIMCQLGEVKAIIEHFPSYVDRLRNAEALMHAKGVRSNFFSPDYIPRRFCSVVLEKLDKKTGKMKLVGIPSVDDVVRYVTRHKAQVDLFPKETTDRRCMSFYGICE